MASGTLPWITAHCAIPVASPPAQALPAVSLIDRFADHLAEVDDIAAAAAAIRVPLVTGQALFDRLCKRLGAQAR